MSRRIASVFVLAVVAAPLTARADRRSFTRTYEYQTMPAGGLELESYYTQATEDFDRDSPTVSEFQLELEYGLTDHTDLAIYQVFEQASGAGVAFKKSKLRGRHRLAERGELPIDTLFYFEVQKPAGQAALALEPKLILARDFGRATAAVNLIAEVELALESDPATGEDETEIKLEEFGWASGLTFEATPTWKLGGELWGTFEEELDPVSGEEELELGMYAGPTVSWGPSAKFWVAVNAGFGITEATAAYDVRAIIGIGLD